MNKMGSVPCCFPTLASEFMKKPWPVFGILARAGLAAAVLVSLILLPLEAHAARTVTSATLNGTTSVTVAPGAAITTVVDVTTDGSGLASRWYSTGWSISTTAPGAVTCVDHANHSGAGGYSETFSISAPATPGTYNAYFIAYSDDACSANASATYTMTNAVTVTQNPVPTTTGISPASKNLGAATFTLTVNGTNFVPSSVVRFAGSDRTTTYVSATQLTATIPASDLTALGAFNITVFNPAPGGGTSNAQTFTITPAPPTVTTNAASGVTSWVATVNGTVSSNGASSTVTFEYGLTTAYGYSITATQSPLAADTVNAAVSADLVGLNCNTTFHYRVKATNSAGTTNGLDGMFTTGVCVAPFPATACAATRYGSNLGCTAADVRLTNIALVPGGISSCVSGTPVTLDLDLTVNFSSPDRWDIGIFIANDGKLPTLLPTSGGASSCSVDILPITPPFLDLDGVPQGTADTCGDGNSSINGGTGSGVKRMTGVTLPCYASPQSGGKLFVPFTVSWDNQKSPVGSLCTSNLYPVPNTTSKCNAPLSDVAIAVVVLPVISKTNGGTTINPGANTTYTVLITNNSGGTLQDAVFTDPAVTDLTVNSISCAAASGATCPTATVAAMQGAGIAIPSANLPNNGSLTFTINATLSSGATPGSHLVNTASVTVGGYTSSATDDDLIAIAPSAAKSFTPSSIPEGAASLLTVTLTNPTASAVTGVSFTDTYPSGMVNTAAANGATTCGGTVTAANNGNSVALSGGTIPASGSCTVTVNITSAAAGSYTNSTGTVTTNSGTIAAASAPLTVDVPVYGSFNACDPAAAPNATCTSTTTVTNSHISTRLAGVSFNLDLVALKTDGSRNTSYSNNVMVELLDASNNSGALDSYNCRSTWTTVIATLTPNPSFSPANNGLITVGSFSVPNAYRDVRVRVTNVGGTYRRGCSTDNFSIRPTAFTLSSSNATQTGSSGTPAIKTGASFNLTAAAVAGYNGAPGIDNTKVVGTTTAGTIGGNFSAAPAGTGTATGNSFFYSEVGNFGLNANAVYDSTFTGVDQPSDCTADFSNVLVGGKYGCSFGSAAIAQTLGVSGFGRFIPDHFDVTGSNGTMSAFCSGFTYTGQAMGYGTVPSLTIKPMNAVSGGTVTQNYQGVYQKLTASGVAITVPTADGTQNGKDGTTKTTLSASMSVGSLSNSSGTLTYTLASGDQYTYTRNANALVGAYTSDIPLVVTAVSDGEVSAAGALPTLRPAGVSVRYGRLFIDNAYGSELLALPVNVTAQYWNGSAYVTNTADDCTLIDSSNLSLSPSDFTTIQGGGTPTLGTRKIKLAKPSPTPTGKVSVDLSSNLGYLPGVGRETFGIYKSKFIYMREMY